MFYVKLTPMRIQTKISLLFSCLVTSIILLISVSVYYFANKNAFRDFYKRLEIRAVIAAKARLERDETNVTAFNDIRKEHLERLPFEDEFFIDRLHISRADSNYPNLRLPNRFYQEVLTTGASRFRKGNVFYAGILYEDNEGDFVVIVSARNEYSGEFILGLRNVLVGALAVGIFLSFFIGQFFSKQILHPIRRITDSVNDISAHSLHKRLDVNEGQDEIAALSTTFNNMLDRLETAFETQNNFISHASHEFNTPLTSIIGEADYALARERTPAQYQQSMESVRTAAERLHSITKSLLHLAQTGFDGKAARFQPIRVDELVYEVKHTIDELIPDNKVRIVTHLMPEDHRKLVVQGNEQLLELAVVNIVLNACKYSGNKPVQVILASTNDKALILVKDEGIGIPEAEVKYIFDPFFRASNTQTFKGFGIGLPLTRNILRIHSGAIIVQSRENQGTEIRLELPILGGN